MNEQERRNPSSDGELPKLTIVIPAYNCAKYITFAVNSAISCRPGCILVSDDGSVDGTLDVARESAAHYAGRIQFHANKTNMGMTAHWQEAMSKVTTEYALKLDGDDEAIAEYVRKAYDLLESAQDIGIVGARPYVMDPEGNSMPEDDGLVLPHETAKTKVLSGSGAEEYLLNWTPYPASSSTIYRMNVWRSIGGFNVLFRCCADREIWFRMAKNCSVALINVFGAKYRIHDQSVTSTHKQNDLFVYEFDLLYDMVNQIIRTPRVKALLGKKYIRNGLSFFASCKRSILSKKFNELPNRFYRGLKSWFKACLALMTCLRWYILPRIK